MTTKLHQILALEKGAKATTEGAITRAYHDTQRAAAFNGLTRTYTPKDQEGEWLPAERKIPIFTVDDIIARVVEAWTRRTDIVATKDATNQNARASVIVGGNVIIQDVPVTTLLYLEKTLQDVRTLVSKLHVLDPEVEWGDAPDTATGMWKSTVEETVRTKKLPRAFVRYEATDKHPAQVDTYTEDIIVGTWARTLLSGALPAGRKAALLRRIDGFAEAVKVAREYANQAEAIDRKIGADVFGYLFAPVE